jgi:hypothetical protein
MAECIHHKIHRPDLIALYRQGQRFPGNSHALAAFAPLHGQVGLTVKSEDPLVIDLDAITPQ